MQDRKSHHPSPVSSWKELLAAPPRGSHVLQLYDCHDFLASAVGHYAAEGLARGEAVLLSGTAQHLEGARRQLARFDVDAQAAQRTGQLVFQDVADVIAALTGNGPLDRPTIDALVDEGLAGHDPRWTGLRWWGEVAATMHARGDVKAALLIEDSAAAAAERHGARIFCSALCDRFDARGYDRIFRLCCGHTHVIPADDYVGHRLAVNRAIAEVVGDIRGSLLQSLSSWRGLDCEIPSSQALLFWLHEAMPEHFDAVLARARVLQSEGGRAAA